MDRSLKPHDTVTVHANDKDGEILAHLWQQPYTMHGMDNYKYDGRVYKGFVRPDGRAYILLSEPLI